MESKLELILIAFNLVSVCALILTFDPVFATDKNIRFEISDCSVQRTSTTEKSGPCPDAGGESNAHTTSDNKIAESKSKVDATSETTPVQSAPSKSVDPISQIESMDPFGSTAK
jgi:hypothetical protein